MKWLISVLIGFLLVGSVVAEIPSAQEKTFELKWKYTKPSLQEFSSLAVIEANSDRKINDIIAGSWDNNIYCLNENGSLLGLWEAPSSITSVDNFRYSSNTKLTAGIAGSLNDYVYVFWPPRGKWYFKSHSLWWKYDTGDDVFAVTGADLSSDVSWLEDRSGQKNSVIVGTGKLFDREKKGQKGKVLAFSYNGSNLWNYTVPEKVAVLATADIDSDGLIGNVIVGYSNEIIILNEKGEEIWHNKTETPISTIFPADFYNHGELSDIIVGTEKAVYAFDVRNGKTLWQYKFNGTVASVSVGRVKKGLIEYYLISSGTKIYAFENSPQLKIRWSYDFKRNIDKHISLDFDGEGIVNGIVFISGNNVYAYNTKFYLSSAPIKKKEIDVPVNISNLTAGKEQTEKVIKEQKEEITQELEENITEDLGENREEATIKEQEPETEKKAISKWIIILIIVLLIVIIFAVLILWERRKNNLIT
jgi:hypothetical protein